MIWNLDDEILSADYAVLQSKSVYSELIEEPLGIEIDETNIWNGIEEEEMIMGI